ncbi:hypothetical protein [Photobacterium carnosum]|uniref:hypothetical protein n=1 Tax=Photobacterium carnosum TaxID=2023717 RepID=UPI001E2F7A25|nr:hypothetical protein [Photobacterium carnosum]MCD9517127.1 hypothetical protein [Photobacterium carnosum]
MAIFDHYTELAIRSIFLGARIHDAAILCGETDRTMREIFFVFCKKNNIRTYEKILIETSNAGYSTPPVAYFRAHVIDFIPVDLLLHCFPMQAKDEMSNISEYLNGRLGEAKMKLSILRARRDSWDGLINLIDRI